MKSKTLIISAFILIILLMSVGYASLATNLNISGNAKITGRWDIEITDIVATEVSAGCDAGTPTYSGTMASFDASLNKPGDKVTYEVTIANLGTIDATLEEVLLLLDETNGSKAITFTTTKLSQNLNVGDTAKFTITATYNEDTNVVPDNKIKSFTGSITYVQK